MRMTSFISTILVFFIPTISYALECPTSCDKPGACKKSFTVSSKKIDYYSNFPLEQPNSCINHVVFVVHGTERNAEARYFAALNAAKTVNKENSTLIISPFFKTSDDQPDANDYYWSNAGWKQGNNSINSGAQISSFAVADVILDTVITNTLFPLLTRITVTGHSAGGQYSQLYALTTANPDKHAQLAYQFLVLNPSNYSYLSNVRPHPYITGLFEKPVYWTGKTWKMKPEYQAVAGNCPTTYNDYKYGLENRNSYAKQLPTTTLIDQYINRKVYYFLGELDTENDEFLDTSCSAQLQGPYRLKRGQYFYAFLNLYFPTNQHALSVVPGIGHDSNGMYNSTIVKTVLFQ